MACAALVNDTAAQQVPVKVIVLAGQSNMEGKAQNKLWEHQATDGATRDFFAPFRDGENTRWVTRDDVWIKFFERKGPLTLGYGSRGRTGLEYAFGLRVGDHFDEPVLLIKTAWGGRSIRKDFRPPSSGLPADAVLDKELADAIKRTENNNKKRGREDQPPTRGQIEAGYGRDYRYDHDAEDGFSGQNYFPDDMPRARFYDPVERGFEREVRKRLAYWDKLRAARAGDDSPPGEPPADAT